MSEARGATAQLGMSSPHARCAIVAGMRDADPLGRWRWINSTMTTDCFWTPREAGSVDVLTPGPRVQPC